MEFEKKKKNPKSRNTKFQKFELSCSKKEKAFVFFFQYTYMCLFTVRVVQTSSEPLGLFHVGICENSICLVILMF